MRVKFLRSAKGAGTVLDTGDVIERVKTAGRRDRLTIRNAQGEEYTVTDHPDFVTHESSPGATIATREGVVIARIAHHTIEH